MELMKKTRRTDWKNRRRQDLVRRARKTRGILLGKYYEDDKNRMTPATNEAPGECVTFATAERSWFAQRETELAANTRKKYASLIRKHILPSLGGIGLDKLKPSDLRDMLNALSRDGYAATTLRDIKAVVSQIIGFANEEGMMTGDPFARVIASGIARTPRRPLSEYERDAFTSAQRHRLWLPAMLMLYCGLRRGEALALSWADVDIDAAELTVRRAVSFAENAPELKEPKTRAGSRRVPLPSLVRDALSTARAQATSEWVCPSADGNFMTYSAFVCAWNSFIKYVRRSADASRIGDITPHMLRHTYCTMLYDAGVDIKSAQAFMGHADVKMTLAIYTHLTEAKRAQAAAVLNTYIGSGPGGG